MSHVKYKEKENFAVTLEEVNPPPRIMPKERNRVNKVIEKMNVGKFIPPT